MMPGAESVIDTLVPIGDESLELAEVWFTCGRGDDHDKGTGIERQKSLASEWMILEMIDLARHIKFPTLHQADDCARLITAELDIGQRMIPIGHTRINGE